MSRLLRDFGGLGLYRLGPSLHERLTRRQMMRLAETAGDLVRRAAPEDVAAMREELLATLGTELEDLDGVITRAWQLRMFNELEVLSYPILDPDRTRRVTVLEGEEHLQEALGAGRGAIIMLGHFGANQMVMPALGHRGYVMSQLSAKPTKWTEIPGIERGSWAWKRTQKLRWECEQALPATLIDIFEFLRPAFECLERNEVLGVAFDGGGGKAFLQVTLGERQAWIARSPWALARKTGATILPTVVARHPREAMHRVHMTRGFTVERTEDEESDLQAAADRYARWFTRWLRRRPDHYAPYLLLRRRLRDVDTKPFFET